MKYYLTLVQLKWSHREKAVLGQEEPEQEINQVD